MIKNVSNMISKKFYKINILDGIRKIQHVFYEKNIECFPVYDNENLVGVLTEKELVIAHPNRIVEDVMTDKYVCIDYNAEVWKIKEIFDSNDKIDVVFQIDENHKIIGFITKVGLNIELGRHIDLLTGLYKSDYIFYNAHNLIKSGQQTSLIFMDLNNFGHIDKEYGHIYGDLILKNIAEILKKNITPNFSLCRYAGDEFAVITSYGIEKCKKFSQKIIDDIKACKFPNDIPVSASIGITECRPKNIKIKNASSIVANLINSASLASTKAKRSLNKSIITENLDISDIA